REMAADLIPHHLRKVGYRTSENRSRREMSLDLIPHERTEVSNRTCDEVSCSIEAALDLLPQPATEVGNLATNPCRPIERIDPVAPIEAGNRIPRKLDCVPKSGSH